MVLSRSNACFVMKIHFRIIEYKLQRIIYLNRGLLHIFGQGPKMILSNYKDFNCCMLKVSLFYCERSNPYCKVKAILNFSN